MLLLATGPFLVEKSTGKSAPGQKGQKGGSLPMPRCPKFFLSHMLPWPAGTQVYLIKRSPRLDAGTCSEDLALLNRLLVWSDTSVACTNLRNTLLAKPLAPHNNLGATPSL